MRINVFSAVEPPFSFYRDLLPYLAAAGYDVEVVISDVSYREHGGPFSEAMAIAGVTVELIGGGGGAAGRGLTRLRLYVRYFVGATQRSLLGPGADINLFLTQPPLFFLWGLVLKRLRKQKLVLVLMDLYPDVIAEAGLVSRCSPPVRVAARLVRFGYRHADALIAIGRCSLERLLKEGVPVRRIHFVPNWPSHGVNAVPHERNPLRTSLDLQDRFVVMYSGNMGIAHYFDDLIKVAARMRRDDSVRFVFVGDGPRRSHVEEAVARHRLENVLFLPLQPAHNLAYSLALADIHFVSLRHGFEGVVVPSKAYSIMKAGRPIVYQGARSGEVARMIESERIGTVIDLGDDGGLHQAICRYRSAPEVREAEGRRAEELANGPYSRSAALARYSAALTAVAAL